MSKAYIYVRVSSDEQVENNSLDTQERVCREYCLRESIEVATVFREEGESAKTANRTQLQLMLKACTNARKQGITHVIIYKIDRLSRDVSDYLAILAALAKNGITLISPLESFDESPPGKL